MLSATVTGAPEVVLPVYPTDEGEKDVGGINRSLEVTADPLGVLRAIFPDPVAVGTARFIEVAVAVLGFRPGVALRIIRSLAGEGSKLLPAIAMVVPAATICGEKESM